MLYRGNVRIGASLTVGAAALAALIATATTARQPAAISIHSASKPAAQASDLPAAGSGAPLQVTANYGKLPTSFEPNRGQTDPRVKFLSRGNGYSLFLTPTEAVLSLRQCANQRSPGTLSSLTPPFGTLRKMGSKSVENDSVALSVLRVRLMGANPNPHLDALDPLPGRANYLIGNDRAEWRTNIPTYARVAYRGVYPGVDQIYYGSGPYQLEYDFVVAPGGDPGQIRLRFEGAERLRFNRKGDLVVEIGGSEVVQHAPVIYQERDGRRNHIDGKCVMTGRDTIGFQVAAHDRTRPLFIDPGLIYSTRLGGHNDGDEGNAIVVDRSGNAYVTGAAFSTGFPVTAGAFQTTFASSAAGEEANVFVTKLRADGSGLVYSTYIGGSSVDQGFGIAVDATGHAYVTGSTNSFDFPVTDSAFQLLLGSSRGPDDAFVAKLTADGTGLVYCTFLGGTERDFGLSIAVDTSGNAYVAGGTESTDFPTTAGAFQTAFRGTLFDGFNAFVTKVKPDGSALIYSTYLGKIAEAFGIAVDRFGDAYVTGGTASSDFPTTAGAFQTTFHGGGQLYTEDAFVTKLNADGSGLVYSTFLGGSDCDQGNAIAIDRSGDAYVTGETMSTDFPATRGAFQTRFGGGVEDAFLTKLKADGSGAAYSTFLGGAGSDVGLAMALDGSGRAYVAGLTTSSDFPTTFGAFQSTLGGAGAQNAFVTKLRADGLALIYSTYLGGSGEDRANGIAVDALGSAYATGLTFSTDFPTRPSFNGLIENQSSPSETIFVTKLAVPVITTPNVRLAGTPRAKPTPPSRRPAATRIPGSSP